MKKVSILLGLDGSEASARAGQFALWLAAKANARIEICHVIDVGLINELVDFNRPGLLGSGPFIKTRDVIRNAMHEVGEALVEKFRAMALGNGIEAAASIVFGDPLETMLARAQGHAFVITGSSFGATKRDIRHRNLASDLADSLDIPYVVVSPEWQIPVRLAWLTTEKSNYDDYLQYGMLLAETLGAAFDLELTAENLSTNQLTSLKERALALIPPQNEKLLHILNLEHDTASNIETSPLVINSQMNTMTILPTNRKEGYNWTIFKRRPSSILEHIDTGAAIFYPICEEEAEVFEDKRCAS